jgi:hypothetical protein
MAFFVQLNWNNFRNIIFFGNFLYIAETYFGVFSLENRYILETYFFTGKKFYKAADKRASFLYNFFAVFQNCFITIIMAFWNIWCPGGAPRRRGPREVIKKKNIYHLSESVSLQPREESRLSS